MSAGQGTPLGFGATQHPAFTLLTWT
jgi:hypothetical protein